MMTIRPSIHVRLRDVYLRPLVLLILLILLTAGPAPGNLRADEIKVEFIMFQDPLLELPQEPLLLPEGIVDVWRQALRRPEADAQRLAAEAIAQAAASELTSGTSELEPAQTELIEIVASESSHPTAVYAAARALIALELRDSAPALLAAGDRHGFELRLLVEPALAEWGFEPIQSVWRDRLRERPASRRDLVLALKGLMRVKDDQGLETMLEIVHSGEYSADVRLTAARAAGAVAEAGLEGDVTRLMERRRPSVLHRLCAVSLLSRHHSPDAIVQLKQFAEDAEPTVVEAALTGLLETDPKLVLPLAESAMQNGDPKVRRRGADAYVAVPTPERVERLTGLLSDVHPDVRRSVRDDLYRLAGEQKELDGAIRAGAMTVLGEDDWRGHEQAALLLAGLDHQPAASRLVELLESDRPEVMVTSAWALRKLAVPETAPELLAHARRQTDVRKRIAAPQGLDEQVAHLFEALAVLGHTPAEELLRGYIPKSAPGYYSRGAAIWSLGVLHAGTPDEELATLFMERLNDMDDVNPELDIVWEMSPIALGWMKARSQESALRKRIPSAIGKTFLAIAWSLEAITGEPPDVPSPPVYPKLLTNWFLEPLPRPENRSGEGDEG